MSDKLTIQQMSKMAETIQYRQQHFDEPITTSVMVVLVSAGDQFVKVQCTGGEFSSIKGALPADSGLPKCPLGHPLMETTRGKKLGYVEDEGEKLGYVEGFNEEY